MRFKTSLVIVVALLNVAVPLMFVWHLELFMYGLASGIYQGDMIFNNGFVHVSAVKVWHVLMYLMFLVNGVAAYLLIRRDTDER
jgi:hypothetical protein